MSKLLRIHMPTRGYLKKYITFYEGATPRVNNKTAFGRYVFAMLSKHTVIRDQHYAPTWLARDQHTEKMTLLVTHRTFTHVGDTVSMEKAAYINHYLKDQFDMALTMAGMFGHYRKGKVIKNALIEFAETHGIEVEVDISIDNLLKIWHRKIQELEPKSYQNITSPLLTPHPLIEQLALFPDEIIPSLSKNHVTSFKKHHPSERQSGFLETGKNHVTNPKIIQPDESQMGLFDE